LAILADPLDSKALAAAHAGLFELGHPIISAREEELPHLHTLLRSVHRPEALLFPWEEDDIAQALPVGIASGAELQQIERFAAFLQQLFALRLLPVDDLALALGDELFAHSDAKEADLAIAYQIAGTLRSWHEMQPDWRLPELVAELANIASGYRKLPVPRPSDYGFEPRAGRITLATQHGAKGLEWDAVFLMGIDGFWIPGTLEAPFRGEHEFLGGDPIAEVKAQLSYLMKGDMGLYDGRTATESVHIDVISERLRLLYVGITRARRLLHLSRSRTTRSYNKDREASPTTILGVLFQYLKKQRG
jgi:DNA helicase-2/ATP-dependent DNA helicase PcrA